MKSMEPVRMHLAMAVNVTVVSPVKDMEETMLVLEVSLVLGSRKAVVSLVMLVAQEIPVLDGTETVKALDAMVLVVGGGGKVTLVLGAVEGIPVTLVLVVA